MPLVRKRRCDDVCLHCLSTLQKQVHLHSYVQTNGIHVPVFVPLLPCTETCPFVTLQITEKWTARW